VAPVYTAGEEPIEGVTSGSSGFPHQGRRRTATHGTSNGPQAIAPIDSTIAKPDDFVVLLGAGSIT
jgi:UDP-N-acetylmuramate--alanine ligase